VAEEDRGGEEDEGRMKGVVLVDGPEPPEAPSEGAAD